MMVDLRSLNLFFALRTGNHSLPFYAFWRSLSIFGDFPSFNGRPGPLPIKGHGSL